MPQAGGQPLIQVLESEIRFEEHPGAHLEAFFHGVAVQIHQARHDQTVAQIDHEGGARPHVPGFHRGNPVLVDQHGGIGQKAVPVEDGPGAQADHWGHGE